MRPSRGESRDGVRRSRQQQGSLPGGSRCRWGQQASSPLLLPPPCSERRRWGRSAQGRSKSGTALSSERQWWRRGVIRRLPPRGQQEWRGRRMAERSEQEWGQQEWQGRRMVQRRLRSGTARGCWRTCGRWARRCFCLSWGVACAGAARMRSWGCWNQFS
ncbi:hypothetical protein T484DRAFT_1936126 [Baffinella frigidus]|nr:hypothetical protein T484DRAFT_1936126 [Cryptophyta sp. CCMP2293]